MVLIVLACLLVLKGPPICELASVSQMTGPSSCQEMPHKLPTQKSTVQSCTVPCAFADIEIAAPLKSMVISSAIYDVSIATPLRGTTEGPAPPPPRIDDRAAILDI